MNTSVELSAVFYFGSRVFPSLLMYRFFSVLTSAVWGRSVTSSVAGLIFVAVLLMPNSVGVVRAELYESLLVHVSRSAVSNKQSNSSNVSNSFITKGSNFPVQTAVLSADGPDVFPATGTNNSTNCLSVSSGLADIDVISTSHTVDNNRVVEVGSKNSSKLNSKKHSNNGKMLPSLSSGGGVVSKAFQTTADSWGKHSHTFLGMFLSSTSSTKLPSGEQDDATNSKGMADDNALTSGVAVTRENPMTLFASISPQQPYHMADSSHDSIAGTTVRQHQKTYVTNNLQSLPHIHVHISGRVSLILVHSFLNLRKMRPNACGQVTGHIYGCTYALSEVE